MRELFTSDTHFGHVKILEYCPMRSVLGRTTDEMNRSLIERWNAKVRPDDVVYHLGDFAFGNLEFIAGIRKALHGTIVLVRGNHDRSPDSLRDCGFQLILESAAVKRYDNRVFMRHHPPSEPDQLMQKYRASLFLCGHVHQEFGRRGAIINVGVDVSNFFPLTLPELLCRPMPPENPSHHGAD